MVESIREDGGTTLKSEFEIIDPETWATFDGKRVTVLSRRHCQWQADPPSTQSQSWFEVEIQAPDEASRVVPEKWIRYLGPRPKSIRRSR